LADPTPHGFFAFAAFMLLTRDGAPPRLNA
jgi:hypothetical protein